MFLSRTNSNNADFIELVKHLDAELANRDGNEHSFYAQFNKIDSLKHVVIAYENELHVGCGAIKEISAGIMEVKRMYTLPTHRSKGVASLILKELERWAIELNCKTCILETGRRQPEAIRVYEKNGYKYIENYGQYKGVENSVCFQKQL
jgi:putative acetyltransferase